MKLDLTLLLKRQFYTNMQTQSETKKINSEEEKDFLPKYADTNTNTQTHPQTQQSNMRWWVGQTKKTGCEVN